MPGSTILSDVRIVDLTSVIFGPYCTQTLADMGADVVKVEPAKGDDFRGVGKPAVNAGMGPCHLTINRGKRSVTWDLKSAAGKAAINQLIAASDIFIHNIREDAIERLGLDFDSVRAIRPDIVYVHCVGFGSGGPYAGKAAYDDLIQGLSGMTTLLPRVDGNEQPRFLPMAIADKVSGLHAVYATLAGLHHRTTTGQGIKVEVPMLESVTHFLLEEHLCGQTFVPPNGPICYQRQVDPDRQPVRTADGWMTIAPYLDARWVTFFTITGQAALLADERLSSPRARYYNTAFMFEKLAEIVVQHPTDHWLRVLGEADIPAARVNDIGALADDPHLQATGFFRQRSHPTEGDYLEMQPPVAFHGLPQREIRPAPLIGQHNDEVLRELGLAPLQRDGG